MTTTLTPPQFGANGTNGRPHVRLGQTRSTRVPWIALGVILVLAGALAFGLIVQSAGNRVAVVVAAHDIEPGQVIDASDLRTVDAAIDGRVATVPATDMSSLLGKTAATRISAGSLVTRAQFVDGSVLDDGHVVVGALLGPGGLPVPNLRAGDHVLLLAAHDPAAGDHDAEPLGDATVYMVTAGSQSGTQFVSLAVDDGIAQRVADAAAAQLLRLVLQPAGTP
jgi:hypothetical protein